MLASHLKAQLAAAAVFALMYFGAVVVATADPPAAELEIVVLLLNLDAYLACLLAGLFAAAMSSRSGLLAGLLTGSVCACLVAIYHFAFMPTAVISSDWHFWLASVVFAAIGGLLWELWRVYRKPAA